MFDMSYDKLKKRELHKNVSAGHRLQNKNINQLELKVNKVFIKDEKISTNSEISNDEDVVHEAYVDKILKEVICKVAVNETDCNQISKSRGHKAFDNHQKLYLITQ